MTPVILPKEQVAGYTKKRLHPWPYEIGVRWLWQTAWVNPSGNWAHTQLVRKRSSTVVLTRWTTVDWSWPGDWNWCVRADLIQTRWTKEEVGRQHQGMDRPGVRQVPEGSGEQGKMEKTSWKIICGAPTTLAVKGLMMMMMMMMMMMSQAFRNRNSTMLL